ncbi:MAG: DUF6273 domain-containing protein [Clostridiales bacterium]|nr:DUF6273 domain-containing protein [Clostridiales bacterium]
MADFMNVSGTNQVDVADRTEINAEIDHIIAQHKENRYDINKLVFESVSLLTASENLTDELSNQGIIRRFAGGITGKNKKLQAAINDNLVKAQYASQYTLQKLAEQNLLSFELVTAVNNHLNSALIKIDEEINQVYRNLLMVFKQTRSDIIQLENRVEKLERNVKLLNWVNSIEYQMWNGIEYSDLDDISRIVCVARDFYDITERNCSVSDILLLKTAMNSIGLNPRSTITYRTFIDELCRNRSLYEKLFTEDLSDFQDESVNLPIIFGIGKTYRLNQSEKYILNGTVSLLRKYGCEVQDEIIVKDLVTEYERSMFGVNIDSAVTVYDFVIELLVSIAMMDDYFKNIHDNEIECVVTVEDQGESVDEESENIPKLFDWDKYKPGDVLTFGNWEGNEIEWNILKISDDSVLLFMTDFIRDREGNAVGKCFMPQKAAKEYPRRANVWKYSPMREYLNSTFLNGAFSDDEKKLLIPVYLQDVNTTDTVFLLNTADVNAYVNKEFDADARVWDRTHHVFWLRDKGCSASYAELCRYVEDSKACSFRHREWFVLDGALPWETHGIRAGIFIKR